MTHTDFICCISRYCHQVAQAGARPERISQIRDTLEYFLNMILVDMKDQPGLFEHPVWGSGRKPAATPASPALESVIEGVARSLAPDVARIRYSYGGDWQEAPSIFFRVVLSDAASVRGRLRDASSRVEAGIRAKLDFDSMGLHDYYNYRSQSECAAMKDKDWE